VSRRPTVALAVVLTLAVLVPTALAARPPTLAEAIKKAVKAYVLPTVHPRFLRIRISTISGRWGAANFTAPGPSRWKVEQLGTFSIGCGYVTDAIRRELRLYEFNSPC
jgi:hypothetical protein